MKLKALFNKLQKASSKNGFEVEYDSRTGNILISFDKNTIRIYYENNKFYTKENDDVEEYDSIKELEEALNDVWDIDLTATGSTTMKPYSYKGKTITASSREEAIQQIVAAAAALKPKKKKQTKYNSLADIDQYALLKAAGFKQDKEDREKFVSNSNHNLTADAYHYGGFTIYFRNKEIFDLNTDIENDLYRDGLSKGLSENEVSECISKYYEDIVKWLKSNKDKLHSIKSISEARSLNIPKCEFKSNDKVVKVIKTIQLVKTKMDEALKNIQNKKDEMGGKKLLQDVYKELGKLI